MAEGLKVLGFVNRFSHGVLRVNRELYQKIKPLEQTAIQNAEALLAEKAGVAPSSVESSTTVHEQVKRLNEFID